VNTLPANTIVRRRSVGNWFDKPGSLSWEAISIQHLQQ